MLDGKGAAPEEAVALFDLEKDLGETKNLAGEYPERVAAMREALAAWGADVRKGATVQPDPPEGVEIVERRKKEKTLEPYVDGFGSGAGLGAGLVDGGAAGHGDSHAALALDGGFAEEAKLGVGGLEGGLEVSEGNVFGVAVDEDDAGSRGAVLANVGYGEAEDGAGVKSELGKVL